MKNGNTGITTHFFSPDPDEGGIVRVTWEHSVDTSIVWARLLEAVSVTANAIPWLKLKAEGHQAGPTGGDTLATTTFIQRVNTEGGLALATGCDSPPDIGSKRFVPYEADYVFYKLNEL